MSQISLIRDDAMAFNGYIRIGTLTKLFRYQSSGGATRWVQRNLEAKAYFTQSGSCWVKWDAARHKYNQTQAPDQLGQADILKLPATATDALLEARRLAAEEDNKVSVTVA
jgi:hypothetical protein